MQKLVIQGKVDEKRQRHHSLNSYIDEIKSLPNMLLREKNYTAENRVAIQRLRRKMIKRAAFL